MAWLTILSRCWNWQSCPLISGWELLHLLCTSVWMVRVISQNWCPMFLSYFCSKKSPNQSSWNTKRVFFFFYFLQSLFIYLFFIQVCLTRTFCQQRGQQTRSKSGWEIVVGWFSFGLIFSCRWREHSSHSLFSVNEMTTLHLSAEADVTYFDSLSNLLFWIIQPAVGTSCLLIIDFFL